MGAMFSCTNPEDYRSPDLSSECGELTATKTVKDISLATNTSLKKYTEDDIIEAYVTSSDEGGNFYKSLSFVSTDGNYGFSMPIDDYNLYTKYEPGRKVYVKMKDRYHVIDMGGSVSGNVIGSLFNNNTIVDASDDKIGRMSIAEYQSILTPSCSGYKSQDDLAQAMTITQAKSDQNLNKLIAIDKVQFTDVSLGKKYFDESLNSSAFATATDHTIKDNNDVTLIVRISSFSTFANQSIPSGNGKIYGVMTKFRNTYQFMIRTEKDVQFTNPRVVPVPPFFLEPFTTNFPNWNKISVTGTQAWTLDTTFGNPGSCAKMSGFANSTNNANEDWLISPVQNLSSLSAATLTFETATRFAGNPLTVLISKNYSGTGNPNSATWTPLSGTLAPVNGPSYVWTASGPININSYTGPGNNAVYIAFKYTSTASASATWEVDNVKITGN